ncbi:Hsp20 family protein [Sneathiella limimaris]|uniref:Hsp20 family protein n=1 Tax=Sneathiella limimaris TaxID=1964213 RepID=UPI00146F259C|nr:Hsp20 family protein [Sneathiella limimaris]
MRSFDFAPLFRPSAGYGSFSRLFNELERAAAPSSYPSYDVAKFEDDKYEIVIAAPGYAEEDIEITVTQNSLTISGKDDQQSVEGVEYLHKGLQSSSLDYRFELSETIKVTGATMDKGLLKISLEKEIPEAMKPRSIQINKPNLIEGKAA